MAKRFEQPGSLDARASDRRAFLRGAAGALALIPVSALACGKKLVCTDTAGLTPEEADLRTTNGYTDVSTDPAKHCDTCLQYVAASPDQCGTCKSLKGPVHPQGYCKLWAQK